MFLENKNMVCHQKNERKTLITFMGNIHVYGFPLVISLLIGIQSNNRKTSNKTLFFLLMSL